MPPNPIVYIVDDDQAVRESLVWLVESIGIATLAFSSANSFLEDFDENGHACIVADLRMPGMSGLELQKTLIHRGVKTPFILMTAFGEVSTAVKAMKAGASDFIEKPFNDQEMLDLINSSLLADGKRLKTAELRNENTSRISRLTAKEYRVFSLVSDGKSNKEISNLMDISIKTVEVHRARVMRKLEVQSVAALVQLYLEHQSDAPAGNIEG